MHRTPDRELWSCMDDNARIVTILVLLVARTLRLLYKGKFVFRPHLLSCFCCRIFYIPVPNIFPGLLPSTSLSLNIRTFYVLIVTPNVPYIPGDRVHLIGCKWLNPPRANCSLVLGQPTQILSSLSQIRTEVLNGLRSFSRIKFSTLFPSGMPPNTWGRL